MAAVSPVPAAAATGCRAWAEDVSLTGQVRWQLPLPTGNVGLNGAPVATADGGQTGAQRWTANGPEVAPPLQLAGGLLLVTDDTASGVGSVLTAITPATGRIAWRFHANVTLAVSAAGPAAGVAVTAPFAGRMYLLDPATGRVRWQSHTVLDAGPLFTPAGLTEIEGAESSGPVRIVDRDAADGRIEWQDTLPAPDIGGGEGYAAGPLLRDGQLALVLGAAFRHGQPTPLSAYRLDSGSLAWRVTMPENAVSSPVPVSAPGPGVLIQPALSVSGCTGPR